MGSRSSRGKGVILGLFGPLKSIEIQRFGVFTQQKKIDNGDSGTAVAGCNAPDWSVSHYIVPREKSAPPAMRPFVEIL